MLNFSSKHAIWVHPPAAASAGTPSVIWSLTGQAAPPKLVRGKRHKLGNPGWEAVQTRTSGSKKFPFSCQESHKVKVLMADDLKNKSFRIQLKRTLAAGMSCAANFQTAAAPSNVEALSLSAFKFEIPIEIPSSKTRNNGGSASESTSAASLFERP
jgi:hypothetical protein